MDAEQMSSDSVGDNDLASLASELGLKVEGGLLETALTHSSFANENPTAAPGGDNERLEYLGDAILQIVVGELFFRRFPASTAGELTRLRAAVVSEEALWRVAKSLGLGRHLRLGHGEETSGGRDRHSLLTDAFEALVGAVYLSGGMREARRFVLRCLEPTIRAASGGPLSDPKTALQEKCQARGFTPRYRVIGESGPDHGKSFEVEVRAGEVTLGRGTGRSKKEAERSAAAEALASWDGVAGPGGKETTN